MNFQRMVLRASLDQCPAGEVSLRVKKHSGIDLEDIPPKYGGSVEAAREFISGRTGIAAVYRIFRIALTGGETITLENGVSFKGKMLPKICGSAEYLACYAATLPSFNEVRDASGDMMTDYFIDLWGTVYAECGTSMVERALQKELMGSGYRQASAWNPGQHRFELSNQRPLFELITPEDIGCVLDKYMRMVPFKSTSGIIPILSDKIPEENDLIPCDFCERGAVCPASRSRRREGA